jgi:hypothetical protein
LSQPSDHYQTLGIAPSADEDDIKRAYRALAKRYHPDRVPVERREWARMRMAQINVAYETLSDPARRAQFDRQQGYTLVQAPQVATRDTSRWHTQRARERSRRGQIEHQRVVVLAGAALLGIALVAALTWLRARGLDTTVVRCTWAIVLATGTLLVLAALRLNEL